MATATQTRPRAARSGTLNAKRSAAAKAEKRDSNGRFAATVRRATGKKPTRSELGGTGGMLAAGAAGLAVGLAANIARKFAVQAPTMLAGEWDEALTAEHQLTRAMFDAIEATTEKNTTKRATLLMTLKHMLAKHALEEENVIYPALRDAGETEAADHLNNDHGYVKQYLYDLSALPKDSPAWISRIREFRALIEKHMSEEETDLFPRLKSRLTPEKSKELTHLMNKEGLKLA